MKKMHVHITYALILGLMLPIASIMGEPLHVAYNQFLAKQESESAKPHAQALKNISNLIIKHDSTQNAVPTEPLHAQLIPRVILLKPNTILGEALLLDTLEKTPNQTDKATREEFQSILEQNSALGNVLTQQLKELNDKLIEVFQSSYGLTQWIAFSNTSHSSMAKGLYQLNKIAGRALIPITVGCGVNFATSFVPALSSITKSTLTCCNISYATWTPYIILRNLASLTEFTKHMNHWSSPLSNMNALIQTTNNIIAQLHQTIGSNNVLNTIIGEPINTTLRPNWSSAKILLQKLRGIGLLDMTLSLHNAQTRGIMAPVIRDNSIDTETYFKETGLIVETNKKALIFSAKDPNALTQFSIDLLCSQHLEMICAHEQQNLKHIPHVPALDLSSIIMTSHAIHRGSIGIHQLASVIIPSEITNQLSNIKSQISE